MIGKMIDLRLKGVTKVYPGAIALDDVSLTVRGGEVVGLIGENGAGKSTLMKTLGGIIAPDKGAIVVDGQGHTRLTPSEAAGLGIAFVHQELTIFENLDVTANVLIGREMRSGPFGRMAETAMRDRVAPILKRLGARFGPDDLARGLSLADQQMLEIARALSMNARLVIFDEPTSSLTLSETARLLDVTDQLRRDGVGVLFITHRLTEIETIADRVVCLRDGKNVGGLERGALDRGRMVRMMVGRDIRASAQRAAPEPGEVVLSLRHVSTQTYPDVAVDLDLHRGEILGMAGLVGAGRTELARAIFGIDARVGGDILMNGAPLKAHSVTASIAAGISLVPEDRKGQGLLLDFGCDQNISLPLLHRIAARFSPFVNCAAEASLAAASQAALGIRVSDMRRPVAELSGGNQQKVVLAKWLAMTPSVFIFDEPTRGIDVGAKAEIYALMRKLADEGAGILMISSDMEEVIGVSDRVAVMCRGKIGAILRGDDMSEENILHHAVE